MVSRTLKLPDHKKKCIKITSLSSIQQFRARTTNIYPCPLVESTKVAERSRQRMSPSCTAAELLSSAASRTARAVEASCTDCSFRPQALRPSHRPRGNERTTGANTTAPQSRHRRTATAPAPSTRSRKQRLAKTSAAN